MAFCEMCGTPIPDGTTRCDNCAAAETGTAANTAPNAAPAAESVDFTKYVDQIKNTGINFVGLFAQIFNILAIFLPIVRRYNLWEMADGYERLYIIPIALIFVVLASIIGYLLKNEKIGKVASIVNAVLFLIIFFIPTVDATVGFYLWLVGVVLGLVSPLAMKLINKYM